MDILEKEEFVLEDENELDIYSDTEGLVYPMDGVKIDKNYYSVFELKRRYDANDKRIILDSDFQREPIWKKDRKAELIESVLMGIPLPVFYFSQDKIGRLIVIDGRQRLTAFFEYLDNRFELKNLKILTAYNNKKFSDLPPVMAGKIEDYQIQANVIMPPTPDRIKFDIFDRVNRGGMQLNKQEIRNALYQGKATRLLNDIVRSGEFKMATGGAFEKEVRMKDRYLVTRFLTMYLYDKGKILNEDNSRYQYKDDIDELLGKGMDTLNHMEMNEIEDLRNMMSFTLLNAYYYLGCDAFRKVDGEKKSPINMNVFETVMLIMLQVPPETEEIRSDVRVIVQSFLASPAYLNNIGNHRDSAVKLQWRMNQAKKIGIKFNNDK